MNTIIEARKNYILEEQVAEAGFGVVYRGQQQLPQRSVAIKIIRPQFASQPEFIRRFEAEAEFVARLDHLHIVPLYDYWRDPSGAYLVMRWMRGGSLKDSLVDGPYDILRTVKLLEQVAAGLAYAHREGIVHRDIKPGNILLDEEGNAYLADFGIAKDTRQTADDTSEPHSITGSPGYLSPEQARNQPVTPRTDVYSLGVVLYELLKGEHPFPNLTLVQLLYKHLSDPLPEIDTLDTTILNQVNEVIQKATAKNPEHRYPSVEALVAAFKEAVAPFVAPTTINLLSRLTPREQEVLRFIAEGKSNDEIAAAMHVERITIRSYIRQINPKLGTRSRGELVAMACQIFAALDQPQSSNIIEADRDSSLASMSLLLGEPENPYKGLRSFQRSDADDFFGREKVIQRLIRKLGTADVPQRFLAVIGPSGSGKSSLVKAGLLPALEKDAVPGSVHWFVVDMLPGRYPLDELETALNRISVNQGAVLREHLERDERGLLRAANVILPQDNSELLLVIDQFEEVFTLVEDEAKRQHFLNLIRTAVTEQRSRVRVIITLRADFYHCPLQYPEFGELVRGNMETLLPLSAQELEAAITEPARQVGIQFDDGLIATIISEVNYQAGALPILQYALTELFERRDGRRLTFEAYQAMGQAIGALAKRADSIYNDYDTEGQELLRQIFLRLVTLGDGVADTRRRTPLAELEAITPHTDLLHDILNVFAEYRLLSFDHDPITRQPTVEVAHEALLHQWERLGSWLDESRVDVRSERLLAAAAAEWDQNKRTPGYLLHGNRLMQFQNWAANTRIALTALERTYLDASLSEHARRENLEREHQVREAALERRSRRVLQMLVGVFVVATLIGAGLALFAFSQRDTAQEARIEAEANADYARSIALASAAQTSLLSNNPDQSLAFAVEAYNSTAAPSGFIESVLYQSAVETATRRVFSGHSGFIHKIDISPGGSKVLSFSNNEVGEYSLIYWELESGQIINQWQSNYLHGETEYIRDVVFDPDGKTAWLTVISPDTLETDIIEFDPATGKEIRHLLSPEQQMVPVSLAFSPDGQTLFIGGGFFSRDGATAELQDGQIYVWDVQTGTLLRQFADPGLEMAYVVNFFLSPDGQYLFVNYLLFKTLGNRLLLWDTNTGELIHDFDIPQDDLKVSGIFFTSRGIIMTAFDPYSSHGFITLLDASNGNVLQQEELNTYINSAALHPDGHTLALASGMSFIRLFDIENWQTIRDLYGHTSSAELTAFSPDGKTLLTGSRDSTIRIWNMDSPAIQQQISVTMELPTRFLVSPDQRLALIRDYTERMALLDTVTGVILHTFQEPRHGIEGRFSPDSRFLLVWTLPTELFLHCPGEEIDMMIWDIAADKPSLYLEGLSGLPMAASFSPDQKYIYIWELCSSEIKIWDALTGHQVEDRQSDTIHSQYFLELSSDGRYAFSYNYNEESNYLWDTATWTVLRSWPADSIHVGYFSTGSRYLYTVRASDNLIELWDVNTGKKLQQFDGHGNTNNGIHLSPDGQHLVSGSRDGRVFVWDVGTGEMIRLFQAEGVFLPVMFSINGSSIFIAEPGVITEYDLMLQAGELTNWIQENRYVRDLSCLERELYNLEPLCEENPSS